MDVLCPVCAEPWDVGEFEEVQGMTFTAARRAFAKDGCGVFTAARIGNEPDSRSSGLG